jgi:DNA modification methylase
MLEIGWDTVTFGFITAMSQHLLSNATVVMFCSLPFGFDLHVALVQSGYQWRWDAVWIKPNGGVGVSKRRPISAHEHLFAYSFQGIPVHDLLFNGYDAGEDGVPWQKTNVRQLTHNSIQVRLKERAYAAGHEDGKRWIRSDLFGKSKNNLPFAERTSHPTQKPLEIVEKLTLLLANPGDIVYDPFLGSGTTLIAAENTGRTCYGCELSATYCSAIIDRWERVTGAKAVQVCQ